MGLFFQLALIVLALAATGCWISAAKHESFLDEICFGIEGIYHREIKKFKIRYVARLKFQERRIDAIYTYKLWKPTGSKDEDLEIAIPVIQKFWLRLLRHPENTLPIDQQEFLEIPGVPLIAHSNELGSAREFLNLTEIKNHIPLLGPLFKLEIHRGMLRAYYRGQSSYFSPESSQQTLTALLQLVFFYERQPSFRLTAVGANQVCPFCRENLHAHDSVFECRECGTRLHETCWKENQHCTTWGCPSTSALPANHLH